MSGVCVDTTYKKGEVNTTYKKGEVNTTYKKGEVNTTYKKGEVNTTCKKGEVNTTYKGEVNTTLWGTKPVPTFPKESGWHQLVEISVNQPCETTSTSLKGSTLLAKGRCLT